MPGTMTIPVIGIDNEGIGGLSAAAREKLADAEVLIGRARVLAVIPPGPAERVEVGQDLAAIVERIRADLGRKRIAVVVTGDPLFYGITRFLIEHVGREHFEILPHVSMMQLAFARVMESWDEAYLADASARPLEEIVERLRTVERAGLFTGDLCPSGRVARTLLDEGIDYFQAWVCENLGARNEVVTRGSLTDVAGMPFSPLNVMILVRRPDTPDRPAAGRRRRPFGNPDEFFRQSRPKRGLLTPAEVRTLALAELDLGPTSVIWDIGAGSGSVAVEAAMLARQGRVLAIEPDPEDCALIAENAAAFGVHRVEVIARRAPEAFDDLPTPDAVFLGATGREAAGLIEPAWERLAVGGRFVTNVATIESVSLATATLRQRSADVHVLMVNLARGVQQLDTIRFEAANPSFLISAGKTR